MTQTAENMIGTDDGRHEFDFIIGTSNMTTRARSILLIAVTRNGSSSRLSSRPCRFSEEWGSSTSFGRLSIRSAQTSKRSSCGSTNRAQMSGASGGCRRSATDNWTCPSSAASMTRRTRGVQKNDHAANRGVQNPDRVCAPHGHSSLLIASSDGRAYLCVIEIRIAGDRRSRVWVVETRLSRASVSRTPRRSLAASAGGAASRRARAWPVHRSRRWIWLTAACGGST